MSEDFLQGSERTQKPTIYGKILLGVTGGFAIGLTIVSAPFIAPALRKHCLPYIPATQKQVVNIFEALSERRGTLLDIGSGDGRIVFEAARRDFVAHGVELNPWLVFYSRAKAVCGSYRAKFFRRDLWKFPLRPYENVVIFGVEQMMEELERKFVSECRSGTVIVACRFPLPNWRPARTVGEGIDTVWVYCVRR